MCDIFSIFPVSTNKPSSKSKINLLQQNHSHRISWLKSPSAFFRKNSRTYTTWCENLQKVSTRRLGDDVTSLLDEVIPKFDSQPSTFVLLTLFRYRGRRSRSNWRSRVFQFGHWFRLFFFLFDRFFWFFDMFEVVVQLVLLLHFLHFFGWFQHVLEVHQFRVVPWKQRENKTRSWIRNWIRKSYVRKDKSVV